MIFADKGFPGDDSLYPEEQKRTRFRYQYSVYQVEYSRNLLFRRGANLDQVYQNIIDLTRSKLDIPRLKTMFGRKNRPHNRKTKSSNFEVRIERPDYNITVFKIHFGKLTLKLYDKGERTLRAEVVVHNAKELKCKREIFSFAPIVTKLQDIMNDFMNSLLHTHVALLHDGSLEKPVSPTRKGSSRLAGVDINKERNLAIMETVLALSIKPGGYSAYEAAAKMREKQGEDYTTRKAAYDIRKLRGKGKKGKTKYETTATGAETIIAILALVQKQIPGVLAVLNNETAGKEIKELAAFDSLCLGIRENVKEMNRIMGIQAAA